MDEDACRRLQRVSALFEIRMLNLIPLLEELKLAVQAEGSKAR